MIAVTSRKKVVAAPPYEINEKSINETQVKKLIEWNILQAQDQSKMSYLEHLQYKHQK
jgi:hypothetical protein